MQRLIEMFQSICPLPFELQEKLHGLFRYREVKKKEVILKPGQVCRLLYFIEKGLIRTYRLQGNGEVTTHFFREDDFATSIKSFYDQAPGDEFMQALEHSRLYFISYEQLQSLYYHNEFNHISRILFERYFRLWAEENNAVRQTTATERYEWLLRTDPQLLLRVAAKYIASYLGMSEVTLSKIRGKKALGNS